MRSGLLDKLRHDRSLFDCDIDALNRYLELMANQQSNRDNSRTYVLEDESEVVALWAITRLQWHQLI